MSEKRRISTEVNKVWLSGRVESEFEYSHEVMGEKFYKTRVRVARLNGIEDCVPIIVPESLITNIPKVTLKGKYVEATGQFRSYDRLGEDGRNHLDLFLFTKAINVYENEELAYANSVHLEGYICQPPIFRTTPLGKQITNLCIAVNRPYKKTDYIPCIAWNNLSLYASRLEVGNKVKLYGKVQSRQYFKRFSPDSNEGENRTAYEISILGMIQVEDLELDD